jgi:hypothetical protein
LSLDEEGSLRFSVFTQNWRSTNVKRISRHFTHKKGESHKVEVLYSSIYLSFYLLMVPSLNSGQMLYHLSHCTSSARIYFGTTEKSRIEKKKGKTIPASHEGNWSKNSK